MQVLFEKTMCAESPETCTLWRLLFVVDTKLQQRAVDGTEPATSAAAAAAAAAVQVGSSHLC
jgi:hypothetical protein